MPTRGVKGSFRSLVVACPLVAFAACVTTDPPLPAAALDAGEIAPDGGDKQEACNQYCDAVMTNCTGELRAFDNRQQCMMMCNFMPMGKIGDRSNSIQCRASFAQAGTSKENCIRASAYGGGVCGDRCDTFCDLVDQNCIQPLGVTAPYRSKSDCVEECQSITYVEGGAEGPGQPVAGEDTLNCRMYHLILSLSDRVGHCPHVGKISETCHVREAGVPSVDGH